MATMLSGGDAENAPPQTATATVNCRVFPGTSVDALTSPMRKDVEAAVSKALHSVYSGVPIIPDQASYYPDGTTFRAADIPTHGASGLFLKDSDSFAHGLNERIPVAAFDKDRAYWRALLVELAGKH